MSKDKSKRVQRVETFLNSMRAVGTKNAVELADHLDTTEDNDTCYLVEQLVDGLSDAEIQNVAKITTILPPPIKPPGEDNG